MTWLLTLVTIALLSFTLDRSRDNKLVLLFTLISFIPPFIGSIFYSEYVATILYILFESSLIWVLLGTSYKYKWLYAGVMGLSVASTFVWQMVVLMGGVLDEYYILSYCLTMVQFLILLAATDGIFSLIKDTFFSDSVFIVNRQYLVEVEG